MSIEVPIVNGFQPDWSSISASMAGKTIAVLMKEIKYASKVEVADVYGKPRKIAGVTRGREKLEDVTLTFYTEGWYDFRDQLKELAGGRFAGGISAQVFSMSVSYQRAGGAISVDELIGMRLLEQNAGGSDGPDPLVKECKAKVMRIKWDGDEMIVEATP